MPDAKKDREKEDKHIYKVVVSELGVKPFNVVKCAFALMGVIPLLTLFYIIIGKFFYYEVFLGSNAFIVMFAILISIIGFLYAYHLVANMVRKLLSYSYERKRSNDEKTELVMSVSHDLKNPLTVINAGIKNLSDGIAGPMNKAQTSIVRSCIYAIDKLMNFIKDLTDSPKMSLYRTDIKRELIDFQNLVKDEVNAISELAKKNYQDLRIQILMTGLDIWGDRQKLSRAVMNLLSNAVKYTPSGGRIDIVISGDENTAKLSIINTGSGIAQDEIDKIFAKHERLARHSKIEGTGLGLSIVKDIIDLHKGHLAVKSEPDRETEFSVTLPRDLRAMIRKE